MKALNYDLVIWRGNNRARIWRFKDSNGNIVDLTGYVFVLTIALTGRSDFIIQKSSAVDAAMVIDTAAGTVTWTPTLAESRLVPLGKHARYELESRFNGVQATLVAGAAIGRGGDNLDT